ncbi:TBC1 domain family member 12-like [Babylonia areolata]|uniref:TBC1 domain family member 12-like n=1 Tax=Babylonia areolata TaxID=304850 RepID=UPI003FD48C81
MRLIVMSEDTGTEPLPGLPQESVPTVPLIDRFEDVEALKCRVQKVTLRSDVSGDGEGEQENAYPPSASGSGRESTLSLSSDDTLNCDDSKSESNDAPLAGGRENTEHTESSAPSESMHERTNSDTSSTSTTSSIKAGLLMSPVLLTEDVPVDVGASNRLSSVLENISLPLLYLPTTKQIVNGDESAMQCSLSGEPDSHKDVMPVSRSDSCFQSSGAEGRSVSLFRTGSSCSDFDRLRPEPDRVTLNSVESFTSATLSADPAARLYDTSSLSSISTGTDFSVEHGETRLMVCEGDENAFIEVNLHGRNSYETSRNSSLDSGFEDRGAKPKKKGFTGFLSRGLFSRKSKEDSAPGWKLFGRVPPKDSGPRDSSQISSDYYAKQRANQIAAAQAKGQNSEVMSTTALILENRPEGLPSKSPEELEKHKQEYDAMVEAARKKEQRDMKMKKRKLQQQRRQEDRMVAAAAMWNKDVLPNWETMKQTKKVRELWWMGLPTNVRGKVWQMAVGNDLNITKDLYEICRSRAEDRIRLIQECRDAPGSPETTTEPPSSKEASVKVIKLDVSRTFPQLCIFQKGGPYHDLMHNLLGAYACYRPDVGYVQGMSFIAAILLLNMDVADAFVCFANLLNRPCQVTFFRMDQDMMGAYYMTFEEFFRENLPELYKHFVTLNVTPNLYLMEWIFLLFSKSLPLDVACRVWDVYCRDGEEFLFQTALGILKLFEAPLLKMDFISVAQFLTKLPDDLCSDALFRSIDTVRMSIDKRRFPAVLATKKDFKADNS